MSKLSKGLARALASLAGAASISLWLGAAQAQIIDGKPLDDAAVSQMKPGLAVIYFSHFFRHIDELVEWESYKEGKPGDPITEINYDVGEGAVLTSGIKNGIGARMDGYIFFEKAGDYAFAFESNDGIRLEIDGQMVVEDPDVHGDRFSDIGMILVQQPGWYPIRMRYFERKNTSTLRFYWQTPDFEGGTMPLVPGEVLKH